MEPLVLTDPIHGFAMSMVFDRGIRCAVTIAVALCAAATVCAEPDQIVINEIMYHPPGDLENLQYVELLNTGKGENDLSGWSFSKGIKFVFPKNTKLASGRFLVICRDHQAFVQRYGRDVTVAGEFEGHLSHNGERLELSDASRQTVDVVKYADSGPWPMAADGHSSSLERICPFTRGDDASNWGASNLPEIETPAGTPGRVNDSFSSNIPPIISEVMLAPKSPEPERAVTVEAVIRDDGGVKAVELVSEVVTFNQVSAPLVLGMERISGDARNGQYQAILPSQPEGRLVRYRIRAVDTTGAERTSPASNDLRGAWSYSTFTNNNTASVPFAFLLHPSEARRADQRRFGEPTPKRSRGQDAFIYVPAGGGDVQTFDFVQAPRRKGGYKVHFLKDQTLRGMTGINIIFEGPPRFVLAEPLAYEVYRLAGVPAELTEHVRLWVDGQLQGYHLLIEQPNKSFLARNKRDTNGNLYKVIWYGRGVVGMHEKKTNLTNGHGDLLAVIDGLKNPNGAAQWAFIERELNVDEFLNYYAVNMCIQNWDGFHNNYFLYHDTEDTKRWEIYPWDEDKTWGEYDGGPRNYDWYELPLNYGMTGSQRPAAFGGPTAGDSYVGWWRAPGLFGGPLLANPQFRQRFLVRLREVCTTIFTKEKMLPLIDAMEKRLEDDVPIRAQICREDPAHALAQFRTHIQTFRNQVIHRQKYILDELEKPKR